MEETLNCNSEVAIGELERKDYNIGSLMVLRAIKGDDSIVKGAYYTDESTATLCYGENNVGTRSSNYWKSLSFIKASVNKRVHISRDYYSRDNIKKGLYNEVIAKEIGINLGFKDGDTADFTNVKSYIEDHKDKKGFTSEELSILNSVKNSKGEYDSVTSDELIVLESAVNKIKEAKTKVPFFLDGTVIQPYVGGGYTIIGYDEIFIENGIPVKVDRKEWHEPCVSFESSDKEIINKVVEQYNLFAEFKNCKNNEERKISAEKCRTFMESINSYAKANETLGHKIAKKASRFKFEISRSVNRFVHNVQSQFEL